jgi:hypothetical protein
MRGGCSLRWITKTGQFVVRFQVLTGAIMKMAVFWVVAHRPDDGSSKHL